MGILVSYRTFFIAGPLVTMVIMWFVAADTARIVSNHKRHEKMFAARLSFWVMASSCNLLSLLPVIGATFSLLEPIFHPWRSSLSKATHISKPSRKVPDLCLTK